jgi:hypothetical protein
LADARPTDVGAFNAPALSRDTPETDSAVRLETPIDQSGQAEFQFVLDLCQRQELRLVRKNGSGSISSLFVIEPEKLEASF